MLQAIKIFATVLDSAMVLLMLVGILSCDEMEREVDSIMWLVLFTFAINIVSLWIMR